MNAVARTVSIAPVRKSIVVDATPLEAFEFFTGGIDRWWPKSHGIGSAPVTRSIIEPHVGGRWYSEHADGTRATVGHVLVWSPGERFAVTWEINAEWKPDPRPGFTSEVDVRFTPVENGRTRVDVEHAHFERMGGDAGERMRGAVDSGWPGILELYSRGLAG